MKSFTDKMVHAIYEAISIFFIITTFFTKFWINISNTATFSTINCLLFQLEQIREQSLISFSEYIVIWFAYVLL